jgi:peptidyl-prolyl cis-trans isomerase C
MPKGIISLTCICILNIGFPSSNSFTMFQQEELMKIKNRKQLTAIYLIFIVCLIFGCGNNEEKNKNVANMVSSKSADSASVSDEVNSKDIVLSVDGEYLAKLELEKEIKELMDLYKDKIPQDKKKEAQANLRKQLMENFIIRTVLENEIEKRKIIATEKEINESAEQIKTSLPPGKKIDDYLKQGRLTKEKFNEDISFAIKVKQLVKIDLGNKAKPSAKEISKFYNENKDKFIVPESVHVRHILIAIEKDDDDKITAEKKAKIEDLHKQLLAGADFAEVARKNSDCPSKENGGDLGIIRRGETVQQFEDAAFSQEKNVIGPVVSTEFGHHIIQVIDHEKGKTISLADAKNGISDYLAQQKQAEAFDSLVKKLRKNAKIIIYEKNEN